jgi:hypothetical protein
MVWTVSYVENEGGLKVPRKVVMGRRKTYDSGGRHC